MNSNTDWVAMRPRILDRHIAEILGWTNLKRGGYELHWQDWVGTDPSGREDQFCPRYSRNLAHAVLVWDGVTRWGHVGIHTDQRRVFWRAMTAGLGPDDGIEYEDAKPARAVALSFVLYMSTIGAER